MKAYETVFQAIANSEASEDQVRLASVFYTSQVRIILSWIDLSDSEQIGHIRSLDSAFNRIIECSSILQ